MKTFPKIIDLFSGAGGLSLGAARAGFSVCGAVEIDPHAMSAHRLNFPQTAHIDRDVSELSGKELKSIAGIKNGDLAGIIGGPPCQGFSCMGKNDRNDTRNRLFVDFFRIVAEAKPRFFLAENVPGILSERNTVIRDEALSLVERDYSLLPPMTMCANDYGAPTTRKRVIFIGYLADKIGQLSVDDFSPPKNMESVCVRYALNGLPVKVNPDWQQEEEGWRVVKVHTKGYFASRLHGHVPPGVGDQYALARLKKESMASGCLGTIHSLEVTKRFSKLNPGQRDNVSKSSRLDPDGFCPTIRAGTGRERGAFQAVRPLHPSEDRVITPREAARLQGFPDWFRFSHTKWHSFRQIGSSVSPILAERILSVVCGFLGDSDKGEMDDD